MREGLGKNHFMQKTTRKYPDNKPATEKLLPHFGGNVSFVFMKEDLTKIRDMLSANKVLVDTLGGYHIL